MNLSRRTTKVPQGAGRYRHRTIVECDVVSQSKNELSARMALRHLADTLTNQPELWNCGTDIPDSIVFVFEDHHWTAISEATVLEGDGE